MPLGHGLWWHGFAEEIALNIANAALQHRLQLLLGLHPFYDHLQLQVPCQPHHVAQQGLAARVLGPRLVNQRRCMVASRSSSASSRSRYCSAALIARSRSAAGQGSGADYIYTYLRTYYRDETKPTGWNNLVFPNIGMPHPLWELQGERKPVMEKVTSHGHEVDVLKGWELGKAGTLSAAEYDQNVGDLVAYLQWMGEPAQNTRVRLGVWVMLFLALFTVVAWRLNASFWKDVK